MSEIVEKPKLFDEPIDIDARSVAEEYAKALFNAAEKAGVLDVIYEEFESLLYDAVGKHMKIADVLRTTLFSNEKKVEMVERVFRTRAHPLMVNFLKVLAEHERFNIVRTIYEALRELYNTSRKHKPVLVYSAVPLTDGQRKLIADRMRQILGGDPVLQTEVDPKLIGGLVVQVGDVVFDGSLSANLARLREQMINRSVHEIQRRRDSVRTAS